MPEKDHTRKDRRSPPGGTRGASDDAAAAARSGAHRRAASPRADAAPQRPERRLDDLYDASKLLVNFERIDQIVSAVLAIVIRSIRLRSAILVTDLSGEVLTFEWPADDVHAEHLRGARAHAVDTYAYFARHESAPPHERAPQATTVASTTFTLPRQAPSRRRFPVEHDKNFLAMPLVVGKTRPFGLLQLEGSEVLDESDVAFASALSNHLAMALARHEAWRREQTAREEAETAAARLRSLQKISDAALQSVTLDDVLGALVLALRDVFDADLVSVLLVENSGQVLAERAGLGAAGELARLSGDTAACRVLARRRPLSFDDLQDVEDPQSVFRQRGVRSLMGAPLRIGADVRGVVCVATKALRHFGPDEIRLLELIADRIAPLIEHARLYDNERALSRQLEAVSRAYARIGSLLTPSSRDVPAVLRAILEEARGVTSADHGALSVRGDPARPAENWVESGLPTAADGRALPLLEPLRAALQGETTVRIDDARSHPMLAGLAAQGVSLGALLGVPLRRPSGQIGIICLARHAGRPAFTAYDERVVELLATHAAIAVENVRLYQTAGQAIRAREDMLAIVSHDLRNPLNTILLTADRGLRAAPPRERRAFGRPQLEVIVRAARRMDGMIHDLLDAATIESGRFTLESLPHPVASLVEEALESTALEAAERGLRAHAEVAAGLPDVMCDRARLLQVLSNLLGNALKFTPAGGEVALVAERAGDEVRFAVRDTGRGIAAADLPHLFDRYWRGRAGDRGGAGLGLYIAQGILAAHGSALCVESEPGQGTTFWFTLRGASRRSHGV